MTEFDFSTYPLPCAVPSWHGPVTARQWRETAQGVLDQGGRLIAIWGSDRRDHGNDFAVHAAFSMRAGLLWITLPVQSAFPDLGDLFPAAERMQRTVFDMFGVAAEGARDARPWLRHASWPRHAHPLRHDFDPGHPTPGARDDYAFVSVEGDGVHEIPVGPVHAGIIEPGHFRFQCHGEQVFHLEISLGYQHRGAERTLIGGPNKRTIHTLETVAGDTSIGHATAYCLAVEALANCQVPARAEVLRGIALELERLANHTGDLGALSGDVAYLPTAAYCGRLRGDWLNATGLWCGNRFGRSAVVPGGVRFDVDPIMIGQLQERIEGALKDVTGAANLLFDSASVQARFENCGTVSPADCDALGLVGPAARACGMECDVRRDFPIGIFRYTLIPISTWTTGDVFARAFVRWLEIQRSVEFIRSQLRAFPDGPVKADVGPLRPNHLVVSMVEGWRGEICHTAITDAQGRFARYKIVDPSFHNWNGLAMALRDQQISDFPLCNKSFNLSYCGYDL
jgi:Ni,Fe-hydrogenase III large subunit/Ni,Fe-hydrogenase III component G